MSKRLRASMRAANKGRNLRPRASTIPSAPAGMPSDRPDEMDERDQQEEADEGQELRASEPQHDVVAEPAAARSADPRALETVREPSIPHEAPAKVKAEAAGDSAPISATQPSSPAILLTKSIETAATTTAAQVPASPDSFKAAPASQREEPLLATTLRTEAPKLEGAPRPANAGAVGAPAPRSEPPVKVEEPKKAAPVVKAEEPKKAAPAKIEEPKKAVPVAKVEEPKKAAPVNKVEEPKKAAAPAARVDEPKASLAKKVPESRRPGALRAVPALDDDHDLSSISAEFFRKDEDSVPPVEEHEEHEVTPAIVLSPSMLARRARFRRLVAGVVAFAGVISIAVVSKAVSASKRPAAAAQPIVRVEPKQETPPPAPEPVVAKEEAKVAAAEPQKLAATEPAKADADPKAIEKADDAKKDDAKKDDAKKPDEVAKKDDDAKKPEEAAKKDDAKPAPSGGDAEALKKETLALLNRGKTKDAIEKAREAIAADPNDATSYLYLGSALQDSGKWKDGIEAYCECVRTATKGPVHECRAMGGHK